MNIQSLKLVCFSPTGTTKAVIQGIARGMDQRVTGLIDITRPDARKKALRTYENELLIIGVPVYMGRVPALITEWLKAIEAHNTPTAAVVVYGNRAYEDALLELKNILTQCGCKVIGGAAFIGEHSFSSDEAPTAKGRPDTDDLKLAELFGRKLQDKINGIKSVDLLPDPNIPGCHPYRWDGRLWTLDFISVSDACIACGICAERCPAGAVDPANSRAIDKEKCITCCACIKNCPQKARIMKSGPVKDASVRLGNLYKERKEPEFLI
jgi:ferredoxin